MATPLVIPGFRDPFDVFDALGLTPSPSYTTHEITVAWRTAFKKIHSDKAPINKEFIPVFPTPGELNRAKERLLEGTGANLQTAYIALRYKYRSTWNPRAEPGTPEVLLPIPGAMAETRPAPRPIVSEMGPPPRRTMPRRTTSRRTTPRPPRRYSDTMPNPGQENVAPRYYSSLADCPQCQSWRCRCEYERREPREPRRPLYERRPN